MCSCPLRPLCLLPCPALTPASGNLKLHRWRGGNLEVAAAITKVKETEGNDVAAVKGDPNSFAIVAAAYTPPPFSAANACWLQSKRLFALVRTVRHTNWVHSSKPYAHAPLASTFALPQVPSLSVACALFFAADVTLCGVCRAACQ